MCVCARARARLSGVDHVYSFDVVGVFFVVVVVCFLLLFGVVVVFFFGVFFAPLVFRMGKRSECYVHIFTSIASASSHAVGHV